MNYWIQNKLVLYQHFDTSSNKLYIVIEDEVLLYGDSIQVPTSEETTSAGGGQPTELHTTFLWPPELHRIRTESTPQGYIYRSNNNKANVMRPISDILGHTYRPQLFLAASIPPRSRAGGGEIVFKLKHSQQYPPILRPFSVAALSGHFKLSGLDTRRS